MIRRPHREIYSDTIELARDGHDSEARKEAEAHQQAAAIPAQPGLIEASRTFRHYVSAPRHLKNPKKPRIPHPHPDYLDPH